MPVWIPLFLQVLPFLESIVKLIVTLLRKKPTERRERIAQRLENAFTRHLVDKDEEKLSKEIKEIQEEIKADE